MSRPVDVTQSSPVCVAAPRTSAASATPAHVAASGTAYAVFPVECRNGPSDFSRALAANASPAATRASGTISTPRDIAGLLCLSSPGEGREQQLEHQVRVAARALALSGLALVQVERARIGQRLEAALAYQLPVDAAEPAAVGRADGHAERRRLAVHRAPGRDDDVGERDQALRIDGRLGEDHRRQLEGTDELPLLLRPRQDERVHLVEPAEVVERHRE